MKFTILLLKEHKPNHCIGLFNTRAEARQWAIEHGGWLPETFIVIDLIP